MNQAHSQQLKLIPLLVMAAVLLLLGIYSFNSSGIICTPGEDEDAGSGFGGTGREMLPGSGSGLGGTGIRPFLGYEPVPDSASTETVGEIRIMLQPEPGIPPLLTAASVPQTTAPATLERPIPRSIDVLIHDPLMEGSGSIHISEAIQRDIDISARTMNIDTMKQGAPGSLVNADISPAANTQENEAPPATNNTVVNWTTLTAALAENPRETTVSADEEQSEAQQEIQGRANRPQNIQRPVLPALQRVRPIQRAGLLPPPIRPLRL